MAKISREGYGVALVVLAVVVFISSITIAGVSEYSSTTRAWVGFVGIFLGTILVVVGNLLSGAEHDNW